MTAPETIQFVRKRDGELESFDKKRIADAIYKAAQAVQVNDRLLADELAEVVVLYLIKNLNIELPEVELVQDVVEKVLLETNHLEIARAYIIYRRERAKAREVFDSSAETRQSVFVNLGGRKLIWHPERIASKLTEKTKLPRSFWEEIVKVIEGIILE